MAKKAQVSTKDAGKGASKNAQSAKSSKGGAKAKKKSWTKVKVKENLNNAVFLDEKQYERMLKEVPKILCITRAVLCEKFKVGGSIPELSSRISLRKHSSSQLVFNITLSTSTRAHKPRPLSRRLKPTLMKRPPRKLSKSPSDLIYVRVLTDRASI